MSLKDIIINIANNNSNKKLCGLERLIFDTYVNDFTHSLINDKQIKLDDICENIKNKLLNSNITIIKLLFSNDQYIYVDKQLLLKIEYFKNMIDDCDSSDDIIINIVVNNNIDNYELMNDIITYLTINTYTTYDNLEKSFDMILLLDFIGYMDMLKCFSKNIMNNTCIISLTKIEKIYDILTKNNIETNFDIENVWLHYLENNGITNEIFELSFFKEKIIHTTVGKQCILDHKYIKHYGKIICYNNYKIIIDELLEMDTLESYEVLVSLPNDYLEIFEDTINDKIFNFDISNLKYTIISSLCIKYDRVDLLNKYFKDECIHNINKTATKILLYSAKYNNNSNEIKNIINKITYSNNAITLSSVYPLVIHTWKKIGVTQEIIKHNNCNVIVVKLFLCNGLIINKQTEICYVNGNNKMTKIPITQIILPYKKDNIDCYYNCDEVFGGTLNYEQIYYFVTDIQIDTRKYLYIIES